MNNQPSGRLARGGELSFSPDTEANAVLIEYSDASAGPIRQRLHRHSMQQMAPALLNIGSMSPSG